MIKSLIVGICLLIPTLSNSQIIQHQIYDDGYAHVPLQFPFPLYGRVFTDSFMYSNGVVGFGSVNNHWCCTGYDLANARGYEFNYSILGLQTDLINYGSGQFTTEGTATYQRYRWQNISEYGQPSNLNTFSIEIRPTGYIGINHENINISSWRPLTIGVTGDTTLGEYTQHYYGVGFNRLENVAYITQSTVDLCIANPLYDSSCAGYAEAYFNQQCSLNSLYDRRCPGYETAYALANIMSAPTAVVSAPVLQVSTTGTVSVETPVVSDPVVNEVITRPAATTNATTTVQTQTTVSPTSVTSQAAKEEPKAEKKPEPKQVATVKANDNKNEVSVSTPVIPTVQYAPPPVLIVDMLFKQMVKKPIQDNNRSYYALIMGSQKTHEEMVDGQYRKRD